MNTATKTRSQRRMEKKQAVLLLVLVLVVSLTSFTLGVMVGRRGAARDLAQKQQAAENILVAPVPSRPAAPPPANPASMTEAKPAEVAKEETKLTFYDDLNKAGTAPLGSGINLPPAEKKTAPAIKPPLDLPEQPVVEKTVPSVPAVSAEKGQPVAAETALIMPKVDPKGRYALQVGSFATAGDAGKLKKRLLDKSYPAFVVEADLGNKGLWYRVRLGPYADADAAKSMLSLMEKQEQLKGFVTHQ